MFITCESVPISLSSSYILFDCKINAYRIKKKHLGVTIDRIYQLMINVPYLELHCGQRVNPSLLSLVTLEPDLKKRIRVHLLNAHGLDEAGIDGGGIFREFLNELLKSGFNPNQGFFKTTNEGLLYPSPAAEMLVGDSFTRHYYFLGRILGKVSVQTII